MLDFNEVINEFYSLSKIPRCTGNEAEAIAYIAGCAESEGFPFSIDTAGNLSVILPPVKGMEDAGSIIIQSHVDMVCVKDKASDHNFSSDPIIPLMGDKYIQANGTTLGADNGIGCAISIALMKNHELSHGPIQLLFTVIEETGMSGAVDIDVKMLEGEYLINLDFESDRHIGIGAAGGEYISCTGRFPFKTIPTVISNIYELSVYGVKAGHSGLDIEKSPENIFLKATSLLEALKECSAQMICFESDGKINAIPTNFKLIFIADRNKDQQIMKILEIFKEKFIKSNIENGGSPHVDLVHIPPENYHYEVSVLNKSSLNRLIKMVQNFPSGVTAYSKNLEDQVQSSVNLGVLQVSRTGEISLEISLRSDSPKDLFEGKAMIFDITEQNGLLITDVTSFPPWPASPKSTLAKHCVNCRKDLFTEEVELISVHAGLECSVLCSKKSRLEAVSIGPTMFNVHTVNEKIEIASIKKICQWIEQILGRQMELPTKGGHK